MTKEEFDCCVVGKDKIIMKAFHGDQTKKEFYITRIKNHRLADNLIQGTGWENGKGCGVGCTLEKYNHKAFEEELGIPEWLAMVEDKIFEGLPHEDAMEWPEKFLSAISPGVDLNKVKGPFLVFILESALETFDHKKHPDVKAVIDRVIYLWKNNGSLEEFMAAWAAARAAQAAAARAARAARAAAAAAWAAWAAEAEAEAWAAMAAAAARAAWAAAKASSYKKFADKLLELLRAAE